MPVTTRRSPQIAPGTGAAALGRGLAGAAPPLTPQAVLQLQRTAGNQAVGAYIARGRLQREPATAAAPAIAQHPADIARAIHDALDGFNNVPAALAALGGHPEGVRGAIKAEFQTAYGGSLADYLYDQLDGADLVKGFALLESSNLFEPHTALGLALIPVGTRDAEVMRVLEGAAPAARKQIEARYDAAFGAAARSPKGLMTGSLKGDLADDLSGWEMEKSLAMLDHELTQAEHLYFLSVGIYGTHTQSVVALIQGVWAEGPAAFAKLEADWDRYVRQAVPGVSEKAWTPLTLREAMRAELSLEEWLLVDAVLDGYEALRSGAAAKPGDKGPAGAPTVNEDPTALEEQQLAVARKSYLAATVGEGDWYEGAGTNEEQVFAALATIRKIHLDRIKRAGEDAAKRQTAQAAWDKERADLKLDDELGGVERQKADLLLGGDLSLADEVYLASRDLDHTKVVSLVTQAWATGKIDQLLKDAGTESKHGDAVRPIFNPWLTVGATGGDAFYRVSPLIKEGSDAQRGAARLEWEIAQGDNESDLRKAYEFLSTANENKALQLATVAAYAKDIPGEGEAVKRFLDFAAARYENSKAVWDLRDLLDPAGERPDELVRRAEGRLEASKTGLADELFARWIDDYDTITGEQTKAVTKESLERLRFLAQKATPREVALVAAQTGKKSREEIANMEYGDFKARLAEAEAVEAAIVDAIATTLELAVSAAITVATGGAAAGMLLASLSSAVAGMLLHEVALGKNYDLMSKENAKRLATVVGGAAMGAFGADIVKGFEGLQQMGKLGAFVGEATQEAFSQVGSGVVAAAFDEKAPTVESISARAISMVVSVGVAGGSGSLKHGLEDASPFAEQVRVRVGTAIGASTMNSLGAKASELAGAGGMGDMTAPELLGQIAKESVQAAQAGISQGFADLGAAGVRASAAAAEEHAGKEGTPHDESAAKKGAGHEEQPPANGGGGGGGDVPPAGGGGGGGHGPTPAEVHAQVEQVRERFGPDYEDRPVLAEELHRQLDKIARKANKDPAEAAEQLHDLADKLARLDVREGRDEIMPSEPEDSEPLREADKPNEKLRAERRRPSEVLEERMGEIYGDKPAHHQAHHIVAESDPRAEVARIVLELAGIDVNDGINGIYLPDAESAAPREAQSRHPNVHTDAYYKEVTRRLMQAWVDDADVGAALAQIHQEMFDGKPLGLKTKQKFPEWIEQHREEFRPYMSDEAIDVFVEKTTRRPRQPTRP